MSIRITLNRIRGLIAGPVKSGKTWRLAGNLGASRPSSDKCLYNNWGWGFIEILPAHYAVILRSYLKKNSRWGTVALFTQI